MIEFIVSYLNGIVWGPITLGLLLFIGIMFSIRMKFFQFTQLNLWMKKTFGTFIGSNKSKGTKAKKGISQFQAMTTALAGAMGTGNIVGVATALTLGGPGAVFWMWIAAIFGMMTIFSENILGVKYRTKNKNGEVVGGPMYYISKGLNSKPLAIIFVVTCTIASFGIGNLTQANAISGALESTFKIPAFFTGLVLMILIFSIVFGGVKRLAKVTEKLVPIMTIFYVLGGLIVILFNIKNLPFVFINIFKSAFDAKAVAGGTGGYVMANAIRYGFSKGVFSNEAGLGSAPIVYSVADSNEPVEQGMWGIFQVFVDTIIGCTITALCILSTGVIDSGSEGIILSTKAFSSVFGGFGAVFVSISITLFAFSTMISWSYYGERSLEYLTGGKYINIYKGVFAVCVAIGGLVNLNLVWSIADLFNGLMILPNLIALVFLSGEVIKEKNIYMKKIVSSSLQ